VHNVGSVAVIINSALLLKWRNKNPGRGPVRAPAEARQRQVQSRQRI